MRDAMNIADLRELARRRLPRGVFEYVDRGAENEVALDENIRALSRVKLLPRALVDVSQRDTSVELFGQRIAMPLAIAPTGSAALLWYEGEEALARAAGTAGVPFTVSGGSTVAMETVFGHIGKRAWFQIYMWQDLSLSHKVIERARAAGIEVLIVTVDSAAFPIREYNHRNGFTQPFRVTPKNSIDVLSHPRWFAGVALRYMLGPGLPRYKNVPMDLRDPITGLPTRMVVSNSMVWKDIAAIRRIWPGALVVKGLMTPEDATLAVDHGADGVVVSNHGGRNLDAAPATIDVLPAIVDAVGHRATVIFDGGVRRGADVVKALAIGAKAVLAGRAPLYGAGAGGQAGVEKALAILKNEIDTTLAFIGRPSFATVDRNCIYKEPA